MVFVLLLLCGYFSWVTIAEQSPEGAAAGRQVAALITTEKGARAKVLIVARTSAVDAAFADGAAAGLGSGVVGVVKGQPPDLRDALEKLVKQARRSTSLQPRNRRPPGRWSKSWAQSFPSSPAPRSSRRVLTNGQIS